LAREKVTGRARDAEASVDAVATAGGDGVDVAGQSGGVVGGAGVDEAGFPVQPAALVGEGVLLGVLAGSSQEVSGGVVFVGGHQGAVGGAHEGSDAAGGVVDRQVGLWCGRSGAVAYHEEFAGGAVGEGAQDLACGGVEFGDEG